MHEDDEITALAGTWKAIGDETAFTVEAALRRRRRQQIAFVCELLACGLALASALYFWFAGDGLVHRATAALFVGVAVVCTAIAIRTRVRLTVWSHWTPEGVLEFRLRECEVALLGAWSGLVACAVLIGFAAFVWLAATFEWDALPQGFPQLYGTLVGVVVLGGGSWSAWRIRTKRPERARLLALLEEMRDS